jgi:hypothetical protein
MFKKNIALGLAFGWSDTPQFIQFWLNSFWIVKDWPQSSQLKIAI